MNLKAERARPGRIPDGSRSLGSEFALTIFAVPKPFKGHIGIIQQNAVESWVRLRPRPEIILFGDEPGTAEVCAQFGLHHEPRMARTEFGAPRLDDVFGRARELASANLLAYVNADIILLQEFFVAAQRVTRWQTTFLMVGRRTDVDIVTPWDFAGPDAADSLKQLALASGKRRTPKSIDYFVFTKNVAANLLPLGLGRAGFDNWLIWNAISLGAAVVDASSVVTAIHQNHDYAHHPKGIDGVYAGDEAKKNAALIGRSGIYYGTAHASHLLLPQRVQRNWFRWFEIIKHPVVGAGFSVWFAFLDLTRSIRHRLGVRSRGTS